MLRNNYQSHKLASLPGSPLAPTKARGEPGNEATHKRHWSLPLFWEQAYEIWLRSPDSFLAGRRQQAGHKTSFAVELWQPAICPHILLSQRKTRFCESFNNWRWARNPLTTNDAFWRHLTLAACYQLVQSVLKIGSVLAERVEQEEMGGCTPLADSAWRLLQLAVESPGQCLVGHLSAFLHKRLHFWYFRQLLVRRSVLWSEGPDYWTLTNEWVWLRSWTHRGCVNKALTQVCSASSKQNWKYGPRKVSISPIKTSSNSLRWLKN